MPSADIAIVKALLTSSPFTVGDSVTYTLTITNNGPSKATSIDVTDTPTNLTITNVSGACATLPCTIASLASGDNTTITVTATIDAAGAFDNVATANADEVDPDPSNNTDSTGNGGTADPVPSADIAIVKNLVTASPFTVGDSVTYSLAITNNGPSTATSIDVTDTPSNLTITNVSGACAALPCTIASLANGGTEIITVTATIDAAAAFDNVATAFADEADPNEVNNTDSTGNGGTADPVPSADVAITKTLDTAGPWTVGDSVTYTLTVANNGPSTATSIDVTDTPSNLTITNVSGACATLPCTIASLANGASTVVTVTATIDAAAAFDNVATAFADETDPNELNNTDSTGNGGTADPVPSADVAITKTLDTAGPWTVGQSVNYTLTVTNHGPSTATLIDVTDTPTNLTITNVGGACASLPCTIASLANGASSVVTVTATIDAAAAFDNVATAFADETDPNEANNTDATGNGGTADPVPSADVAISKTLDTAGPWTVGDSVTYTLTVTNNGPSTATSIDVTDTPTNLTITDVSGACATFPCTIASLANGASSVITVTATIDDAAAFDNVATAFADEADPNEVNNTDSTGNGGTADPVPSADIAISKTLDTAGPWTVGDSVTYTLTVTNNGPSAATSIEVTDMPTNLTITSVSGACASLPCTIASLANGGTEIITVTATIDAAAAFDNVATANADEADPNEANNTDSTGNGGTADPVPSADVAITKTLDTDGPWTVGQSVTYTLTITNNGPSTATSIDVTDTPTNLTITNVGGACASLPCTIASLANGASTVVTVTATIDAAAAFDNVATAFADEADPNEENNTDDTGNGGTADPSATVVDLAVEKIATAAQVEVGELFSFVITVRNLGPGAATNVVLTDPLPANFSLVSVDTTRGSCTGTSTIQCGLGTLLDGEVVTVTISGTATATGSLSNTASAAATEVETVMANNSATVSPVAGAAIANVPTASETALMILAALLALAGAAKLRLT